MSIFKKICIVLTNRSEYAKIKLFMQKIRDDTDLELSVLVSGSLPIKRYGNSLLEIARDGINLDRTIKALLDGDSISDIIKSASLQMIEESLYFEDHKPDLVILVGDRWELIPIVFVLSLFCIPIAHIQGGEKSGTIDDTFRNVITKYSHIHFVSNERCKNRVINMDERHDSVHNVGCPGLDFINKVDVGKDVNVDRLSGYIKDPFTISKSDKYFMVVVHPNVTIPNDINIKNIFTALSKFPNKKIWFYPNEDPFHNIITSEIVRHREIIKFNHIPMEHFIMLMAHSACFIGNSSAGIRETASFGTPTVNIGKRQIGRDRNANVIDVSCEKDEIYNAVNTSISRNYPSENIYGDGNASDRIIKIIKSYRELNYKNIIK